MGSIVFGHRKVEVTGELRKSHDHNDLYSPKMVWVMGGACSRYGGEERHMQGFVG